jgi:hypothetical protein
VGGGDAGGDEPRDSDERAHEGESELHGLPQSLGQEGTTGAVLFEEYDRPSGSG